MSEPARWTQAEYDAYMLEFGGKADPKAWPVTLGSQEIQNPPPKRTQPKRHQPNKTESAYAIFLDQLKTTANVKSYRFESVTLLLAPGCRYTPDFFVVCKDGTMECHEVKTRWRNAKQRGPNMTDDARVKLLTAAQIYPEFNFVLAWPDKHGGWNLEYVAK